MNKKGMEMWWIIGAAALALLAVIILAIAFKSGGEKGFGVIESNIEGLKDCDKDRIADLYDKCKCDPSVGEELPEGQACAKPCTGNEQQDCVA